MYALSGRKEYEMDRDRQRRSQEAEEKKVRERAEKARKELDEIPPPGTDPLHEGP